jgi:serine protease inhibitor ecotin
MGETEEQHQQRHWEYIYHILDKLEKHDLYLKPEKCKFTKQEIKYLGVIIGQNKIQMDPGKLKGIVDWPVPRNPTEVQ